MAQDDNLEVDALGTEVARGFGAALRHIAQQAGGTTARAVASMVDHPTAHLRLDGGLDPRAPALAGLTLVIAAGVGALPWAVHRVWEHAISDRFQAERPGRRPWGALRPGRRRAP